MTLFDWWSDDAANDARAQPRNDIFIELVLTHADVDMAGCHSQSINGRGAYIDLPTELSLPEDSAVTLRFHIWTGHDYIARFLRGKVVRSEPRGVAIRFTDQDLTTQAVVQDILYYQQFERRNEGRALTPRSSFGAHFSAWVQRLIS